MMKQEVKEVSQHSVGKTVSSYLNFDNAYNGTPPPPLLRKMGLKTKKL